MPRSRRTSSWTSTFYIQFLAASSSIHSRKAQEAPILPETLVCDCVATAEHVLTTSDTYLRIDVKLSASPNVTANAQVFAHLKPSIEFGLSLAGHDTGLYLELDTYAELDLSLTAASGSGSTDGSNLTSTSAGGCVDIFTGLSVNAGADADLLGLFSADDKVVLYDKSFDLYKACFENGYQPGRRHLVYRARGCHGRRVPLSLFEQNLRKDHHHVQPQSEANGAVIAVAAASASQNLKSGKGFSCPRSPMKGLPPIVSQKVNATR